MSDDHLIQSGGGLSEADINTTIMSLYRERHLTLATIEGMVTLPNRQKISIDKFKKDCFALAKKKFNEEYYKAYFNRGYLHYLNKKHFLQHNQIIYYYNNGNIFIVDLNDIKALITIFNHQPADTIYKINESGNLVLRSSRSDFTKNFIKVPITALNFHERVKTNSLSNLEYQLLYFNSTIKPMNNIEDKYNNYTVNGKYLNILVRNKIKEILNDKFDITVNRVGEDLQIVVEDINFNLRALDFNTNLRLVQFINDHINEDQHTFTIKLKEFLPHINDVSVRREPIRLPRQGAAAPPPPAAHSRRVVPPPQSAVNLNPAGSSSQSAFGAPSLPIGSSSQSAAPSSRFVPPPQSAVNLNPAGSSRQSAFGAPSSRFVHPPQSDVNPSPAGSSNQSPFHMFSPQSDVSLSPAVNSSPAGSSSQNVQRQNTTSSNPFAREATRTNLQFNQNFLNQYIASQTAPSTATAQAASVVHSHHDMSSPSAFATTSQNVQGQFTTYSNPFGRETTQSYLQPTENYFASQTAPSTATAQAASAATPETRQATPTRSHNSPTRSQSQTRRGRPSPTRHQSSSTRRRTLSTSSQTSTRSRTPSPTRRQSPSTSSRTSTRSRSSLTGQATPPPTGQATPPPTGQATTVHTSSSAVNSFVPPPPPPPPTGQATTVHTSSSAVNSFVPPPGFGHNSSSSTVNPVVVTQPPGPDDTIQVKEEIRGRNKVRTIKLNLSMRNLLTYRIYNDNETYDKDLNIPAIVQTGKIVFADYNGPHYGEKKTIRNGTYITDKISKNKHDNTNRSITIGDNYKYIVLNNDKINNAELDYEASSLSNSAIFVDEKNTALWNRLKKEQNPKKASANPARTKKNNKSAVSTVNPAASAANKSAASAVKPAASAAVKPAASAANSARTKKNTIPDAKTARGKQNTNSAASAAVKPAASAAKPAKITQQAASAAKPAEQAKITQQQTTPTNYYF
jgi:hypothetical protein